MRQLTYGLACLILLILQLSFGAGSSHPTDDHSSLQPHLSRLSAISLHSPRFIELAARSSSQHRLSAHMRGHSSHAASSSSSPRRSSFAARAARRHRKNAAAAKRRAGNYYSKYLHARDSRLDFGCGSVRCVCPLSENASFAQLRVEAYRLRSEQRLQESAACMSQAMDTYLARAGRYYVPLSGDGAAQDLSSTPVTVPTDGPVSLAALAHSDEAARTAAMEASMQRGLSPQENQRAHEAAQAIVDKLNRAPADDWSVRKRRTSPQLTRVSELSSASDIVPHQQEEEDDSHASQQPSLSTLHHHLWQPETDPKKAHEIAAEYQRQLREQWLSWENQQKSEETKSNAKQH